MDKRYWNKICKDYQTEVLSVYDNDQESVVERRIRDSVTKKKKSRAADLGCGVGRFTPMLAKLFDEVEACDFSEVGLRKSRGRCSEFENVNFHRVDLSNDPIPFAPVDFAFCVNVLIMPSLDKRLRAWRAVANQVEIGGRLLLVLPSQESVQMEFYTAIETRLSDGESSGEAVRNSIDERALASDLRLGVHQLDGVRTKHYLREEVANMLESFEFEVESCEKVVYPKIEDVGFHPWDWLAMARRK